MKNLNLENLSRPEAFQTGISKMVRKKVLQQLKDVKEPILDACCGNGIFLLEYCAINSYKNIYGVDIDQDALEAAQLLFQDNQLEPPTFITHDVYKLPFDSNRFGTIFCLNTLLNIHPFGLVEKLILELFRVLKPNGQLFIDFRNGNNPVLNHIYKKNIKTNRLTTYAHKKSDFYPVINQLSPKFVQFQTIGNRIPLFAKGYLLKIRK